MRLLLILFISAQGMAGELENKLDKIFINLKERNIGQEQRIEKKKFAQSYEGKTTLSVKAISNIESERNLLVIENNAYDVEGEESSFNQVYSINFGYKKNLWRGGIGKVHSKYMKLKYRRRRQIELNNRKVFNSNMITRTLQIIEGGRKIQIEKNALEWLTKIKDRVVRLVKVKVASKLSLSHISFLVSLKEVEILEMEFNNQRIIEIMTIEVGDRNLRQLIGILKRKVRLNRLDQRKNWNQCRDTNLNQLQVTVLNHEEKIQSAEKGVSFDLIASGTLSDVNSWNSPSFNARMGVMLNIPLGSVDASTDEFSYKRKMLRHKIKTRKRTMSKKNDLAFMSLGQKISRLRLISGLIIKFEKKSSNYFNSYMNDLLVLDSYLNLYNEYSRTLHLYERLKYEISTKFLINKLNC